jgi:hypothetical protein
VTRLTGRDLRVVATRLGVVACVGLACLVGAGRLDDTVAVFDFRADANAAATFGERTYPESPWVAGSAAVLEDARLWMPEDATYRVVEARELAVAEGSGYGRHFVRTLLLPRTQTESESARWVFCYACTATTLGPEYEVLSDSGDGLLFARRRS